MSKYAKSCHVWRKPVSGFRTCSDTNRAVHPHIMARGLKFGIYEVEGLYYLCSENKSVATQLICAFLLEYAKSRFSHDIAQMILVLFCITLLFADNDSI